MTTSPIVMNQRTEVVKQECLEFKAELRAILLNVVFEIKLKNT